MAHALTWKTAAPLWDLALEDDGVAPARFGRPALLRFASDDFMEKFGEKLGEGTAALSGFAAREESWREPKVGWIDAADAAAEDGLKLFTPAHSRFYLVTASLVCKRAGLPDRAVDTNKDESATFVVRRLTPRAGVNTPDPGNAEHWDEMAWLGNRQEGRWAAVADASALVDGEETLPLFSVAFEDAETGRKRRLWAGMVPVGSREIYESGARASIPGSGASAVAADPFGDPRIAEFVPIDSALLLIDGFALPVPTGASASEIAELQADYDDQLRQLLATKALEFADFLAAELPDVWEASSASGLGAGEQAVFARLTQTFVGSTSWHDLLRRVSRRDAQPAPAGETDGERAVRLLGGSWSTSLLVAAAARVLGSLVPESDLVAALRAALPDVRVAELRELVDDWGGRLLGLTDAGEAQGTLLVVLLELADFLRRELPAVAAALFDGGAAPTVAQEAALLDSFGEEATHGVTWVELLADAEAGRSRIWTEDTGSGFLVVDLGLDADDARGLVAGLDTAAIESAVLATALPPVVHDTGDDGAEAPETPSYYAIRCVYQRPACIGFEEPLLSDRTRTFRLASFFDSDAPIRPIEIRMPTDTDIGGLSKSPKNVSVLLSRELRKQMDRAQAAGLKGLTDGEVPSGSSFDLGMICSFSIPIITICALILLLIIVSLLNIVFWWLPFFRICLPLPRPA